MKIQRLTLGFLLQALFMTSGSAFAHPSVRDPRSVATRPSKIGGLPSPQLQSSLVKPRVVKQPTATMLSLSANESENVPSKKSSGGSIATAATALVSWGLTVGAAKFGWLPGVPQADGTFGPYTNSMITNDFAFVFVTAALAIILMSSVAFLTTPTEKRPNAILKPRDGRKVAHILCAPCFMITWPFFSGAAGARILAATVPLINGVRLYLAANSPDGDASLAAAVSRTGNKAEALGGPFIYVIILASAILMFWRENAAGVVGLSTMACGDGLADLIGRRFGKNNKWPVWLTGSENRKSVAGSLALVFGTVVSSTALLMWFKTAGCLSLALSLPQLIGKLTVIGIVSAIVELIPIADDNYTVPGVAALLSLLLIGS